MAGDDTKSKNKPEEGAKKDVTEKQSWEVEFWSWVADVLRWTADTLFNCLAAWYEWFMSWVSKLSEKLWSKDPEVIDIRKKLTAHHIWQTKESFHNVKNGALKVGSWVRHTAVWAVRTVLASWKDTIKWLREEKNNIVEMPDTINQQKKKAA